MSNEQFQTHDGLGILSKHVMEQGCLPKDQAAGKGRRWKGDASHRTTLVLNPAKAHVVSLIRR
jgi:hypothetical protein